MVLLWPFVNLGERRPRALWRVLLFVLLSAALARAFFGALSALGVAPGRGIPSWLLSGGLVRGGLALASVVVATLLFDRRPAGVLGLQVDRRGLLESALGVGLGGTGMALAFGVLWALGWVSVGGTLVNEGRSRFGLAFAAALAGFTGAALGEELVFRAYLLRNLADGLACRRLPGPVSLLLATVPASVAFGLVHADNPNATWLSTANVTLAGVMFSLGYVLSGRLALPTGLHLGWNVFQGNVFGFAVSGLTFSPRVLDVAVTGPALWTGGAFGVEGGLVGLALVVLECAAVLGWARWRGLTLASGAAVLGMPAGAAGRPPAPGAPAAPEGPEPVA